MASEDQQSETGEIPVETWGRIAERTQSRPVKAAAKEAGGGEKT